jgi:hypothetical protein
LLCGAAMSRIVFVLLVACSRHPAPAPRPVPAALAAIARDTAVAAGLAAPVLRDHLVVAFESPDVIVVSLPIAIDTPTMRIEISP